MSETVHATCVAIGGHGVLLVGRSGAGKSDLALRLIDRGAALVADDRTSLSLDRGTVTASAPATIAGLLEVRGVGILPFPARSASVALVVDLDSPGERLPDAEARVLAGIAIPLLRLDPAPASAPIKVELALARAIGAA